MVDISVAVEYLKANGIGAIEDDSMLVIPYDYVHDYKDKFESIVATIRALLKNINYDKSWLIDPYYYSKPHGLIED